MIIHFKYLIVLIEIQQVMFLEQTIKIVISIWHCMSSKYISMYSLELTIYIEFKIKPTVNSIDFHLTDSQFFNGKFQLIVTATDGGGKTDTAQLLIEVENLNDNLPSIKAAEVVYLDSNLQAGDLVIDLEVKKNIRKSKKIGNSG